ncbi:MATE family efflux transporter [Faecalibaculum rodentium]|uniref:MATE family efflux transporter n=1 Tax=Faecalibaculum rodentium TaxID=1702221 RepID=UPI0020CD5666|nr:MATE family efflux transporter [Faecalibaculum rodentium]
MFSSQSLKQLIIPLFLEQLLVALVGIADVFVIGFVSEAAVSVVSLVNSFNTIFLNLFVALAAGGAVIISQCIGKGNREQAGLAAGQLLTASILLSILSMFLILVFDTQILGLLFGRVEPSVMEACVTYLRISAYSYPALAIYNAGSALYRSLGDTKTTMVISVIANLINLAGNCVGVFVLHTGVAGVAWPSLICRLFCAWMVPCRKASCVSSCPMEWKAGYFSW